MNIKTLGWSGIRLSLAMKMLLNGFLEEHRKVEEQGAIIAKQQRQIESFHCGPPKSDRPALSEQTYAAPRCKLAMVRPGSPVIDKSRPTALLSSGFFVDLSLA
jgi:hypothetical protein